MRQVKVKIVAALKASAGLAGVKITPAWPKASTEYPCIAYYAAGIGAEVADGRTIGVNGIMRFDCFAATLSKVEDLADEVVKVMDVLGYYLVTSMDVPDSDPAVYHKVVEFRVIERV